jgi:universal stress protein A
MNMQNELIEAETNYPAASNGVSKVRQEHKNLPEANFGVWTSGAINKNGLKTILVPTDFSEYSDMALRAALEIAKQQSASIYLLHITKARQTTGEKERMQAQIDKFPDAKSVEIIPDIRKGTHYEEILKMQIEKKIDLIVIALQDTTKSLPFLKEGTAKKVIKKAKCSVMVIGK